VDPDVPLACYCPSSLSYEPAPLPFSDTFTCSSPLPLCPGYFLCDPSCRTCTGPSPSECMSCYEFKEEELVRVGNNPQGRCLPSCEEGQYRDNNGNCQEPDCHALNGCSQRGKCVFDGERSVCDCEPQFSGNDCSVPRSCPSLNECNGQGTCSLNAITGELYCRCNFPWEGLTCTIKSDLNCKPKEVSEIGGERVLIYYSGFSISDQVRCTFDETEVEGQVIEENEELVALCFSPPQFKSLVDIPLYLSVNGGERHFVRMIALHYSGKLPVGHKDLDYFRLEIGEKYQLKYLWTDAFWDSAERATLELMRWRWDPYLPFPQDPVLESLGVIAEGENDGKLPFQLPEDLNFEWETALYILSLRAGTHSLRLYAHLTSTSSKEEYDEICASWASRAPHLSFFEECPDYLSQGITYDQCYGPLGFPNFVRRSWNCQNHLNIPLNCYYRYGKLKVTCSFFFFFSLFLFFSFFLSLFLFSLSPPQKEKDKRKERKEEKKKGIIL